VGEIFIPAGKELMVIFWFLNTQLKIILNFIVIPYNLKKWQKR